MLFGCYKQRRNKWVSGVLAGFADRFQWNLNLTRAIFVVLCLSGHIGLVCIALYVLAAVLLPYKEDVYAERYGTGPRKVKDAEKIHKYKWF